MQPRVKVPTLRSSDILIRLANPEEVPAADRLVFRNYVEDGMWPDDISVLEHNDHLRSSHRTVFGMWERGQLIGTMSIIKDSPIGLPSDVAQPSLMQLLRAENKSLVEVSAFAMDRHVRMQPTLALFLISYMFQYSFYYAGADRLVASCVPAHADFYESVLGFTKLSSSIYYPNVHTVGLLISLNLIEAHHWFAQCYPPNSHNGESFYRFMFGEPHTCQHFPAIPPVRPRNFDWAGENLCKVA